MRNYSKKAIVAASPLLLLLVLANEASAYMAVTFHFKPISFPINWENKSQIGVCLTRDQGTCETNAVFKLSPAFLTEDGVNITRPALEPWIGQLMDVKTIDLSTNETTLQNVSSLDPRGKTSARFHIFNAIEMKVSVRCAPNFYGRMCENGCTPELGLNDCDEEGRMICTNGKFGLFCSLDKPLDQDLLNATLEENLEYWRKMKDAQIAYRMLYGNAAALVDEKTPVKDASDYESDDVIEEKQRKMTVTVGAVALLAFGGVLIALTVARNRRRYGHIRGQLDTLVEA